MSAGLPLVAIALAFVTAHACDAVMHGDIRAYVGLSLLHGGIYLAAVWFVLAGRPRRSDLLLILCVALLLRGLAMLAPANLTTDALRYVWDGRIQAEGFNPYMHVPADPHLAHLRDAVIYPGINQKETSVTVYPPLAEMIFLAVTRLIDSVEGVKAAMLACEGVTIWATLQWLSALRLPRERIVVYAWHPLPIWELSASAHIDAAAIAVMMLAVLAVERGRQSLGAGLLAAAACIKYFPAVLIPALWHRWDWRAPAVFVAVVVALYLPYVFGAGTGVVGYFGGLVDNEGYGAGWGFHPIWMLRELRLADPPARVWIIAALLCLAGLGAYALLARASAELRPSGLVLLACAFVACTSPHYPWYFAWIVPLLCAHLSPAALAMTLLCVVLHYPRAGGITWTPLFLLTFYLPALMALTLASLQRGEARHGETKP